MGSSSHAEGSYTKAFAENAHAEGTSSTASSNASHAEGIQTAASGRASHAEGQSTIAQGLCSHAEGENTRAVGSYSHSAGTDTIAMHDYSHACGQSTVAYGHNTFVIGKYNISYDSISEYAAGTEYAVGDLIKITTGDTYIIYRCITAHTSAETYTQDRDNWEEPHAFVIGNGSSQTRSNAFTVNWDGSVEMGPVLKVGNTTITESQL